MRPGIPKVAQARLVFASAAVLFWAGAAAGTLGEGENLAFAPKAGSTLIKHFERRLELELIEITLETSSHGERSEPLQLPGFQAKYIEERSEVLQDEYIAILAGRPRALRRTFNELSGAQTLTWDNGSSWNVQDEKEEETGIGELRDSTVLFTLEEGEDQYVATFEIPEDGDEELLEGLEQEVDLLGFLPHGEVSVGDTWKIGPEVIRRLYDPGGPITLTQTDGEALNGFLENELIEALEGEVEVRLAGFPSARGILVACLEIQAELNAKITGSEEAARSGGFNQITTAVVFDFEGELLWDLEARHLHGLELVAEVTVEREVYSTSGGVNDYEQWLREKWEGTLLFEAHVDEGLE